MRNVMKLILILMIAMSLLMLVGCQEEQEILDGRAY